MIIKKKYNNNILLAEDQNGDEVILLGKRIAFNKKIGDLVDNELIERKFVLDTQDISSHFKQLLKEVPVQRIDLINKIIEQTQKELNVTFDDSIYIALTDHINYALIRYKNHELMKNALLWEIKRFYPHEFNCALKAIDFINYYENVSLSEDEAGYIALHFVNAQTNNKQMNMTLLMTEMLQEIMKLIMFSLNMNIDVNSLNYSRLMTHLKYFILRVLQGELTHESDYLYQQVKASDPEAYQCALKVKEYFKVKCQVDVSEQELTYLIIHLHRIRSTGHNK